MVGALSLHMDSRLVGIGGYDALTAGLVENAGFDVVWVGSFESSISRRIPDVNLITYTEMAASVRAVRSGCRLPILVDADNGYGSDDCALRALEMFAAAGAGAVCLEDNSFPKRNSLYATEDRALEDPRVFAERLKKLAASGTGVRLIARTEALVAGLGVAEAVDRLERYAEAGVDALFVQANAAHMAQLPEVLHRVAGRLLPIVLAPTAAPQLSAAHFFELGAQVVLFANVVSRVAIQQVSAALARLRRTGTLRDLGDAIAPLPEVFALTGAHAWNGP